MLEIISEISNVRLLLGLLVALVSGLMHGYTGFGGGLLIVPLLAMLLGPVEGVFVAGVAGIFGTLQLFPKAARIANWSEVGPAMITGLIATPIGVLYLVSADPEIARRGIGGFVLISALIMMTGWAYRGPRGIAGSAGAGLLSGAVTGAAGAGGPFLVMYFLAAPEASSVQRANILISMGALIAALTVALGFGGAITPESIARALLVSVMYVLGTWIGGKLFERVPATWFRPVALWLLVATGVSVLVF